MVWLAILAIVLSATAVAQPQIAANGVLNAASSALIGWPDSSIAQGSIFSIYGTNLGPSSSPALAYPLQTTLGGVSVQVLSEGMTLNAIPIFVSPTLINAIVPDNTPTGDQVLTVPTMEKPVPQSLFKWSRIVLEFSPLNRTVPAAASSPVRITNCIS